MKIIIVNKDDKQIGLKEFGTLKYEDIYRVSALWLTDISSGDALIAQRKWSKYNDPGKRSASVSGTVDKGESYEQNIVKEIEEEIGLTNLSLKLGPKEFIDDSLHKFFVQWFLAKVDKDKTKITIQKEEVEGVEWIPIETLIDDLKSNPDKYTPNFYESLKSLGY
ncbi:MAG TPA: NUDIX domain-containing protein [Candidatus Saccharimonadales bacterium]|nr:NUDIX domain-containing protein [Candidatus Saccharimonadales bacterium]